MQGFQIQYIYNKRTTWLVSLGLLVFAVLNSGYNENLFTDLQEAVKTEWIASDKDSAHGASWQIVSTSSSHVSLSVVTSISGSESYSRLALIAYKVANLENLNYCNNQDRQSGCQYYARRSLQDNDDISNLG